MVPKNLVPIDKWPSTNLVPLNKWSLEYSICPGGQAEDIRKYGDQIGWGPFFQGDQILGDHLSRGTKFFGDHLSKGINFMGIVCPGGQKVRTRSLGIKWVRDQMCLSHLESFVSI